MLGVEKSFQDRIWQSAVNIVTCLFMKMQWKAVDEKFKVSKVCMCCSGVGHTGDIGGSEWADSDFFLPKKLE